jgi:hypothetical protein
MAIDGSVLARDAAPAVSLHNSIFQPTGEFA